MEDNREDELYDMLGNILGYGLDDTDMLPSEIVDYMYENDEMPEELSLWEPLECESPRRLVEDFV